MTLGPGWFSFSALTSMARTGHGGCLTWSIDILDNFLNMHDPRAGFVRYVDEFGTNWTFNS